MTNPVTEAQNLSTAIESIAQLAELYEAYAPDLRIIHKEQIRLRDSRPAMNQGLDDIEAEITYLRLREHRPDSVVEIGRGNDWAASWILRALRDNGTGTLHSLGRAGRDPGAIPAELACRRRFAPGRVRRSLAALPDPIEYLFVDAYRAARSADRHLPRLVASLRPGTPVSVGGVFGRSWSLPWSESKAVLSWLGRRGVGYFTAAAAARPSALPELRRIRRDLGLDGGIHCGESNPMVFFTVPAGIAA